VTTVSLNRLLPIEAGHNFRELGGYQTTDGRQVQWHRLIRAGALGQLSEADLALLA
jgi:protein-tyrosine phosphatase